MMKLCSAKRKTAKRQSAEWKEALAGHLSNEGLKLKVRKL